MATTAPWASASVLERTTVMRPLPSSQRWASPQVSAAASLRRNPPSDSTATRARSKPARSAACSGVSKPRPRGRGFGAVSRITARTSAVRAAGLALGPGQTPAPTLQRLAHAPVPAGRIVAGPFVYLGDGGGGQAQGGNTGAGAGADGQVAGYGEGFRRHGTQVHVAAPAFKEPPLGAVDAAGVVGEDGRKGVGHAPVGGPQGRR